MLSDAILVIRNIILYTGHWHCQHMPIYMFLLGKESRGVIAAFLDTGIQGTDV